jgi:GntR family transcriptional regulator
MLVLIALPDCMKGGEYLILVDKSSRIPLYLQLMDILIEEMENNLHEHEQLPSEREICNKYDVSRTTVRQAITELERDGLIYKVHGKGTYVSPKKVKQDLVKFYSFTEEMKKLGKKPVSKVLSFDIIEADQKILDKLSALPDKMVYRFSRLRLADNIPMMVEETYLPYKIFNGLTKEELETTALYDIFSNRFNIKIDHGDEFFRPVMPLANEINILDMPSSIPSLRIERFTYWNDTIIEYTNSIARGDKFKYHVRLEK